jgi:mRNA interferase RelE/StbE
MKNWIMRFTPEASRLLSKLHPENKRRIKRGLEELKQNPYPGKDLQEELSGFKSLRLKQYRVVYNVNEEEKIIQIFYIGRRSDVYEQFRHILTELKNSASTV